MKIDRTGIKYGRLLVIRKVGKNKHNHIIYECKCDCGKVSIVEGDMMASGNTRSCGCLHSEITSKSATTHGHTKFGVKCREYITWCTMKSRCKNPKNNRFHLYGGRGIKVCRRWKNSFENFLADMGKKPTPKHSIERKKLNIGYTPNNCIWADALEQANNRSTNRLIEHDGKTKTLAQWSRFCGISCGTIDMRIKRGWSIENALTTPLKR